MKTINVYSFDELSQVAQFRAWQDYAGTTDRISIVLARLKQLGEVFLEDGKRI